jgi:hypothetical protein
MTRADKVASFYRVDAASGTRKRLAFDSSATYVDQEEFHVFLADAARCRCRNATAGSIRIS